MCVNDLLVIGVEFLFFFDYYVIGKFDVDVVVNVVVGIGKGCEWVGCVLVGGEIVEMLGMYYDGDYDLVGFCVGVVEWDQIIIGDKVGVGDILIVVGLFGFYFNGYLLIWKIIEISNVDLSEELDGVLFS